VSPKVPFDNLEGAFAGLSYFMQEIPDKNNLVVISQDAGGLGRAKAFHKHFSYFGETSVGLAMLNKERKEANKIEKMELVGDVTGKTCVIVDDMIDTAGTLCEAAKVLKEKGAKKVYAFSSQGLFSGPAAERIRDSALEKVITTDSIPVSSKFKEIVGDKYSQVSLGQLIAETIRRVHQHESFEELYQIPVY
jgi:ribose-phosphate pyrophosphokinase